MNPNKKSQRRKTKKMDSDQPVVLGIGNEKMIGENSPPPTKKAYPLKRCLCEVMPWNVNKGLCKELDAELEDGHPLKGWMVRVPNPKHFLAGREVRKRWFAAMNIPVDTVLPYKAVYVCHMHFQDEHKNTGSTRRSLSKLTSITGNTNPGDYASSIPSSLSPEECDLQNLKRRRLSVAGKALVVPDRISATKKQSKEDFLKPPATPSHSIEFDLDLLSSSSPFSSSSTATWTAWEDSSESHSMSKDSIAEIEEKYHKIIEWRDEAYEKLKEETQFLVEKVSLAEAQVHSLTKLLQAKDQQLMRFHQQQPLTRNSVNMPSPQAVSDLWDENFYTFYNQFE